MQNRRGSNWAVFFDSPIGQTKCGLPPATARQIEEACKPIKTRRYPSKLGSTTPGRNNHPHGTPRPIELGQAPKYYWKDKNGCIRRGEGQGAR